MNTELIHRRSGSTGAFDALLRLLAGFNQGHSLPGAGFRSRLLRREALIGNLEQAASWEPVRVVAIGIGLVVLPAAATLHTLEPSSLGPSAKSLPTTPGYTCSLLLFLVPLFPLGFWLKSRRDLHRARTAFWPTIGILASLGFVLELLFGNAFFRFPNPDATLGWMVSAVRGGIPVEEFVFYVTGFMTILLIYIWADEYWVRAYHRPDGLPLPDGKDASVMILRQGAWSSVAMIVAAVSYKKLLSAFPEGFPWYFSYLVLVSWFPSASLFPSVRHLVNWRAFVLTLGATLLLSLLWEVTLAIPNGWWHYRPESMIGISISAWHGLPIEAVCVWFAAAFNTVIVYESIKLRLFRQRLAPKTIGDRTEIREVCTGLR